MWLEDNQAVLTTLQRIRSAGVRVALDDYGTGHSSLARLHDLPVDELKIDRRFISAMVSSDIDATIVRSTIDMAHELGITIVAEGVEDAETWMMLRGLGCDAMQGFFFGRPQPHDSHLGSVGRTTLGAQRSRPDSAKDLTPVGPGR